MPLSWNGLARKLRLRLGQRGAIIAELRVLSSCQRLGFGGVPGVSMFCSHEALKDHVMTS